MTADAPKPAKSPCPSCPYRRDVPSGVWAAEEYAALVRYDGSILDQMVAGATGLFMCHQQNGCLCSGWLACHGVDNLLAIRLNEADDSKYDYESPVPLFGSGAEAALHGMADIEEPGDEAIEMVAKLERMQAAAKKRK